MIRTKLQERRRELRGSPSAGELAKSAGLSLGQVSQIERGEVRPGGRARVALAKALKITAEEFDRFWLEAREAFLVRELDRTREALRAGTRGR